MALGGPSVVEGLAAPVLPAATATLGLPPATGPTALPHPPTCRQALPQGGDCSLHSFLLGCCRGAQRLRRLCGGAERAGQAGQAPAQPCCAVHCLIFARKWAGLAFCAPLLEVPSGGLAMLRGMTSAFHWLEWGTSSDACSTLIVEKRIERRQEDHHCKQQLHALCMLHHLL